MADREELQVGDRVRLRARRSDGEGRVLSVAEEEGVRFVLVEWADRSRSAWPEEDLERVDAAPLP